jgi:hypothetical protein
MVVSGRPLVVVEVVWAAATLVSAPSSVLIMRRAASNAPAVR